MKIVKFTLIPVGVSKYFDEFLAEVKCPKTYYERYEFIKNRHLEYVIEQLVDFEPRLKFKIKKGMIVFESNNWRLDLHILTGASIMEEVEKIEII